MNNVPSPQSFIFSDDYVCRWDSCLLNFDDAEVLYDHIKNAHVGRKAQHNLCLTCKWENCVATFGKRDHITSHVRVHVDLKPYGCIVCNKVFKRPQDLKKHEKIHTDEEIENAGAGRASSHASSLLPPGSHDQVYQPLSPQSYMDRSPSIASSTVSSTPSPYHTPMSPASMVDPNDPWGNPGLASPYSTNSEDLFNSPRTSELEVETMNRRMFGGPTVDVTGTFYGQLPVTSSGLEDIITPLSAKRTRDGFDEILFDTLTPFVSEAKKKRVDPPVYDEDMAARLNALTAILEFNPLTPNVLASNLSSINDLEQFGQFNQYCSDLFENLSGESYEPQSFVPLFPDYEQKRAVTLETSYNLANYNAVAMNQGLANGNDISTGMGFSSASQENSIYGSVLPEDMYATQPSLPLAQRALWDTSATVPAIRTMNTKSMVQQATTMDHQYVSLPNLMNANIKPEPQDEPRIKVEGVRTFNDVSTQTKAKQQGNMMVMERPTEKKESRSQYDGMDPTLLIQLAPAVPATPMPQLDTEASEDVDQDKDKDQAKDDAGALKSPREETATSQTASRPATSGKYSDFTQKARAKEAEVAAAAAAAAATKTPEALDPIEAMTRQLAQTRLDESKIEVVVKPAKTKPVTEGNMDRQIQAATARALCEQDPVRKQHAEVVLNLLKSIDELMADHKKKVAVWKEVQVREQAGISATRNGSSVARGNFSVHNQEQIRTVSSYLSSRAPSQPSPLHQDLSRSNGPDYSRLHESLADASLGETRTSSYSDMPVLYPSSDVRPAEEEPFELTEEERRYIEEDNARIATARESYQYVHV